MVSGGKSLIVKGFEAFPTKILNSSLNFFATCDDGISKSIPIKSPFPRISLICGISFNL